MVRQTRLTGLCRIAIAVVALALAASPLWAEPIVTVRYVKGDAAGANNGTSWTDAFTLLESALAAASSGDEIWVAAGTYKPTSDYGLVAGGSDVQDRLKHFRMENGVGIYGGFGGTETLRSQRNSATNVTTLSGDIGAGGDNSDNCYHVFYHPTGLSLNNTALVDGFTITGGNANAGGSSACGGGMCNWQSSSPTVANCTFSGNTSTGTGGAMFNYESSAPTVTNCAFSGNSGYDGGGMSNYSASSPAVTNCTFSGNSATTGGGMYNYQSSAPTVRNCAFSGNSATTGGGMLNYVSSPTVTNCVLWGDTATTGAEVYNHSSSPVFSYCDIGGCGGSGAGWNAAIGTDGGGNMGADPLFVNAAAGNLRLQTGSPCIDSANGSVAPATDKDGNTRHDDPGMPNVGVGAPWADMGAYEFQGTSFHGRIHVKADATGANTGVSWEDAFVLLQSGLDLAVPGDEIWVAAGTYMPTSDYGLVAEGTDVQDRLKHFRMKNGVGIYGGFAGTETLRTQRNWEANATTLSGDIGTPSTTGDNSYHLFYHWDIGLDTTAVLDGFTVCLGNANGSYPHSGAGGMLNYASSPAITNCMFHSNWATGYGGGMENIASSPVIANCLFSGNGGGLGGGMFNHNASSPSITGSSFSSNGASYGGGLYNNSSSPTVTSCTFTSNTADPDGGGIYNQGADCSPTFSRCTFGENSATSSGGGMFNSSASPAITNCTFSGNSCTGIPGNQYGGGMYNNNSAAVVTNCLFIGNSGNYGGGMCTTGSSSPTLTNCSFNGNSAAMGGAMFNWTSCAATVFNCILWGDSVTTAGAEVYNLNGTATFHYCDIDTCGGSGAGWVTGTGTDGGGNIESDPLYVDAPGGDLRLRVGSPCIDAADGAAAPDEDIDGNSRVDDPGKANTGVNTPDYADIGAYEYEPVPIVVTYPSDSGISLERGKICNIAWVTTLPLGTRFKIELVKGSGGTWTLSANASKTPLKWTVGKAIKGVEMYPDGDDYKIRISTLNDSESDESDNDFAIGAVESLTVAGSTKVTGGNTAQYTCTAHYTFGADRDVTNEVKWSCTKVKGIKMGKTGLLATAPVAADQNCAITAAYGKGKPPITDTLGITVTP